MSDEENAVSEGAGKAPQKWLNVPKCPHCKCECELWQTGQYETPKGFFAQCIGCEARSEVYPTLQELRTGWAKAADPCNSELAHNIVGQALGGYTHSDEYFETFMINLTEGILNAIDEKMKGESK